MIMTNNSFLRLGVVAIFAAMMLSMSISVNAVAAEVQVQVSDHNDHRKLDTAFTKKPTGSPTFVPTANPTKPPTVEPTPVPTKPPTNPPTLAPVVPTEAPSKSPTKSPTKTPTKTPTKSPTLKPTKFPTKEPTLSPTISIEPTSSPTVSPTDKPTGTPTLFPTFNPTLFPTDNPTDVPSDSPSRAPVVATAGPTSNPSDEPSTEPTRAPVPATGSPTRFPTFAPTLEPSRAPVPPTKAPTKPPTMAPTLKPTRAPVPPTQSPTSSPTVSPTLKPSRAPVAPTEEPSNAPTDVGADQCGTIKTVGSELVLGPISKPSLEKRPNDFNCNTGNGSWFAKSYVVPSYAYTFTLTQKCEYLYKTPSTTNGIYEEVRDVNSWFHTAAITFVRTDNSAYRVSRDNIGFNGLSIPDYRTDLYVTDIAQSDSDWCPENYCVKVTGKSIDYIQDNYGDSNTDVQVQLSEEEDVLPRDLELIYAFSSKDAKTDFYKMLYDSMRSNNKDHIFLTNHFTKCGCDSFCFDDTPDEPNQPAQATCYVEEVCGERIFKISYKENYQEELKPKWYETGTTQVMEWFSACAQGQYNCLEHPSNQIDMFTGSINTKAFPNVWQYNSYDGFSNVYGLGGREKEGFPESKRNQPYMVWYCPSKQERANLFDFGKIIEKTQYMKDAGLESIVPTKPCEPEIINPPDVPDLPPQVGPECNDINHVGYCHELPGGTCYIRAPTQSNCVEVEFVIQSDSIQVFNNTKEWMEKCITVGTDCVLDEEYSTGIITNNGVPNTFPVYQENWGWYLILYNRKNDGQNTMKDGYIYYDCPTWEGIYGAKNFTDGAGDSYDVFGNTYGDLFTIDELNEEECTLEPTTNPSESPTISFEPSYVPTQSPTVCSESYLDSESLNIALVVDLSFSTYEKQFSSTIDIGDVNGDGKGNTILDAQILAIQDLLMSIALSDTLNNANTEIELISFETDADSHGVWKPLNDDNESYNNALMECIKKELRAPTSNDEVFNTNNGFTNFDAALDRTVTYFETTASPARLNLLVFLSDGEPNVRGDGDNEMYCADTTIFWNGDGNNEVLQCSDLNLSPGEKHTICRGDDSYCVENEPYQDCVRGPTECLNSDAVTQYDSEIASLTELKVARLAIGVGDESNVSQGSALWMIDDNPAKNLGVLPIQALSLEELSTALSHLCILNTDPPTGSPSTSPSDSPTKSPAPSSSPTDKPSTTPTNLPSDSPTDAIGFVISTPEPTANPSNSPTVTPSSSPTASPSSTPSTSSPTKSPTASPTVSLSDSPSVSPTASPSEAPSGSYFPSTAPTATPTRSPAPSNTPSSSPTASPSSSPTSSPSASPTTSPTSSPSNVPTSSPSSTPTITPTTSSAPTFVLPECYDGPKLIKKDSSTVEMCYYNQDMVQINDMNSTEVTIAINNVWTSNALPEQMQVFVHTNGVDSVTKNGDGFQCLDMDGTDIDIEGDNEFTVGCYQESENDPFLAVIDVVITDSVICGSNDVSHPCYPDDNPIMESCSWRLIIPCDYKEVCTDEPSSSPSAAPTLSLSGMPTDGPSSSPSSGPTTSSPTASPTDGTTTEPPIVVLGGDDDDDRFLPPIGPEDCPDDILLIKHDGVTTFPVDAVRIISQDTTTVTVALQQSFTTSSIDYMFYQYNVNVFDNKCYEEDNIEGGDYIEITIECTNNSQIGLLEFWVADDIKNGVLSENDNAIIPECCHPDVPKDTPVTKYFIEIKCVTECPEVYE